MKIRIDIKTKYGTFFGKSREYNEQAWNDLQEKFIVEICKSDCFIFETHDDNRICMTKGMIQDSLFMVNKIEEESFGEARVRVEELFPKTPNQPGFMRWFKN